MGARARHRPSAFEHLANDPDVLARTRQRLREGLAVPAFDHLRARYPKAQDHPALREMIKHRKLFCDTGGGVVEGNRIAHDHDRRFVGTPGERRCHEVRRWHRAVCALVVFVHADAVESGCGRVLELIQIFVIGTGHDIRVEETPIEIDPDAFRLAIEPII